MNEKLLLEKYSDIEGRAIPIKNFLHDNLDNERYEKFYKGFLPLQSPIVYEPEILFLGYNPGAGAYFEAKNNKKEEPPVRIITRKNDSFTQVELDWYKDGCAYGKFQNPKEKKGWESYKWYQTDKQVNNDFPVRMLKLLNEVAKIKYPMDKNSFNSLPSWYQTLGQNIIYYNLYPIATTNISDLRKIHTALSKEKSLLKFWQQSKGSEKRINNWVVRKYFIEIVTDLIELTRPKIIVCLGVETFNDFCFTKRNRKSTLFKERIIKGSLYPVVGIDRSGNWSGRIPEFAKKIVENQKPSC